VGTGPHPLQVQVALDLVEHLVDDHALVAQFDHRAALRIKPLLLEPPALQERRLVPVVRLPVRVSQITASAISCSRPARPSGWLASSCAFGPTRELDGSLLRALPIESLSTRQPVWPVPIARSRIVLDGSASRRDSEAMVLDTFSSCKSPY
jgi:hypothetical protein